MAAGLPGESSISIAGLRSAKEIFNGNVAMLTPYLSKNHIQKKISLIILILISMLLCACFPALNTQCRHKAIFCASVMRESCPVRIVTGLNPQGIRHAQAQAQVNKKWKWLTMRGDEVYIGKQDYMLTDTYYFSFNEYILALTTILPPKSQPNSGNMAYLIGKKR